MAELYGAANQDSGVSSYISAASPAPSTGFGHSLGVSAPCALCGGREMGSGLCLHVVRGVSSSRQPPQPSLLSGYEIPPTAVLVVPLLSPRPR